MTKACDARGTNLTLAYLSCSQNAPVSRPFTELARQTVDRVYRECPPPSSRSWFVPPSLPPYRPRLRDRQSKTDRPRPYVRPHRWADISTPHYSRMIHRRVVLAADFFFFKQTYSCVPRASRLTSPSCAQTSSQNSCAPSSALAVSSSACTRLTGSPSHVRYDTAYHSFSPSSLLSFFLFLYF
jgi:hypothetical protein